MNSSARLTLATADEELMDKWMDGLKQLLAGLVVRAMALGHSCRAEWPLTRCARLICLVPVWWLLCVVVRGISPYERDDNLE